MNLINKKDLPRMKRTFDRVSSVESLGVKTRKIKVKSRFRSEVERMEVKSRL